MRHTMIRLNSARRYAWLVWASAAVASAWIVSTAFAGAWHDDFKGGGLDDWVVYDFDPGAESWDEKDGFVVGEARPGHMSFLQLKPRKPADVDTDDWNNYTVNVKARLESKPRGVRFGLMLYDRLDIDQYNLAYLKFLQANLAQIVTHSQGPGGLGLGIGGPLNLEHREGVWYDLTATIETLDDSERVTFTVEDHVALEITSKRQLHSGGVGLIVSDGRVSFDDFVVEGDSIPDGQPWSVSPAGLSAQIWAELKSRE